MGKTIATLLAAAFLAASCVSTDPPKEPGDACEIFEERASWWRSVKRAEKRWGAPPALVLAIIRAESSFDHDARPPRRRFLFIFPGPRISSAHGYAQALETTWEEYERAAGDEGLDRNEFRDAADFVAWYARGTQRELGLSYADARAHYLAYHQGRAGYRRGAYRGDNALLNAAGRVQRWREAYQRQLNRCADDLDRWRWMF